LKSEAARHTALTNLFSGGPARGIVNRIMLELGPLNSVVPTFPSAAPALAPLRAKAESLGEGGFSPLWCGQNATGCSELPAAEITRMLAGWCRVNTKLAKAGNTECLINGRTWLDSGGHPHTEALRMIERLRRPDLGHIEIDRTFVDPGALKEPWTAHLKYVLDADDQPLEYVCNENERDRAHMTGTASDEKSVPVDAAVLERYAGTYEFTNPTVRLTFAVIDGRLIMTRAGPDTPLTPHSQTQFFVGRQRTGICVKRQCTHHETNWSRGGAITWGRTQIAAGSANRSGKASMNGGAW
jgi:hypothetical protein